jgi:hypothetical protein
MIRDFSNEERPTTLFLIFLLWCRKSSSDSYSSSTTSFLRVSTDSHVGPASASSMSECTIPVASYHGVQRALINCTGEDLTDCNGQQKPAGGSAGHPAQSKIAVRRDRYQLEKLGPRWTSQHKLFTRYACT